MIELLDAERDALALRVDRQHHGLQLIALLVATQGLLAGLVPGDVGEMDQAVDAAVQADEDAEVGDRLDLAGDRSPFLWVTANSSQGFIWHCFMPSEMRRRSSSMSSTMTSTSSPSLTDLARVDVLVGPVHLGDVDQTLDALLDLDEAAVVGDVGDLAEDPRVLSG